MKVACFSTKSYDRESFDLKLSKSSHKISFFELKLDVHTASLAKGFDAICTFVNDELDEKVLSKLSQIGINQIVLRCAGYNQVDLKAAKKYNFTICRVPAYSPEAVAEHAFALILTLSRKTNKAYNRVRESNFSLVGLTGFNLHGKTVGVVGTGAIGRAFSKIALGFGCKVIAYDVYPNEDMKNHGIAYVSLEDLFTNSDIISLHCPLTPETHHLVKKETLKIMKQGVMLINTSRGALIHTKEVIRALKKKKVGYLGIDVYEQEEDLFFQNLSEEILQDEQISRLMSFPNVLVTGHQAFLTKEALAEISRVTLLNLDQLGAGGQLDNVINL